MGGVNLRRRRVAATLDGDELVIRVPLHNVTGWRSERGECARDVFGRVAHGHEQHTIEFLDDAGRRVDLDVDEKLGFALRERMEAGR